MSDSMESSALESSSSSPLHPPSEKTKMSAEEDEENQRYASETFDIEYVSLPLSDAIMLSEYAKFLQIKNIEKLNSSSRVWLGHFQKDDIIKRAVDSSLVLIKKSKGYKGHKYSLKDPKNKLDPLPNCSLNQIEENNSEFYRDMVETMRDSSSGKRQKKETNLPFVGYSNEDLFKLHKCSNLYQSEKLQLIDYDKPKPTVTTRSLLEDLDDDSVSTCSSEQSFSSDDNI